MSSKSDFALRFARYLDDVGKANSEEAKAFFFLEFIRDAFSGVTLDHLDKLYPVLQKHLRRRSSLGLVGRPDALLGNLLIEFKIDLQTKLRDAESQLKLYTAILWSNQGKKRVSYLAMACDGLRDMLDAFSERFGLIASFTAEKVEEWYDLGYTEYLGRRFDYTIELTSLKKETLSEFLRIHHKVYRKEGVKVSDELVPFTEDSVTKLVDLMPPQYYYPGYFLPNCKDIARLAFDRKKQQIEVKFVEDNFEKVTFR